MELTLHKIDFWQEKLKTKVVEAFIPSRLHEESRVDALERIQNMNKAKQKAMLLVREISEKYLGEVVSGKSEVDEAEQKMGLI